VSCSFGLAEEWQQLLEQEFQAFLRDPVTAGDHGARDVAGVQPRLVGDGLAESARAADRLHRHGQRRSAIADRVLNVAVEGPEVGVRHRQVPGPSQLRGVLRYRVRADRPQRPGSRPSGDGHRGPASRAVAPRSDAGRRRDAPEPAACAAQLYTARPTPGVLTPGTNRKVTVLGSSR
jgi:hypothetical protein